MYTWSLHECFFLEIRIRKQDFKHSKIVLFCDMFYTKVPRVSITYIIYAYIFKFMKIQISKLLQEQKWPDFSLVLPAFGLFALGMTLELVCYLFFQIDSTFTISLNFIFSLFLLSVPSSETLLCLTYIFVIACRLISLLAVLACNL